MKQLWFTLLLIAPLFGQGGFSGPGQYEIANIKSGKVLDLDRNDQTTVIQFSPRGTDNQTWYVQQAGRDTFFLRNGMNGNALSVVQDSNSAPVQGLPFTGDVNQQWVFEPGRDGGVVIRSQTGRVLDIPNGTNRDGARVQVFEGNGGSNQLFSLRIANGAGRPYWMEPSSRGAVINCSSDDGRRHYCDADTRGGVQITRQISGSACIQGQTWGFDQRGIWVDRGCRAEFQITPVYVREQGNRGPASVGLITCSSDDGGRHYCNADVRQGVRLSRQISGSACIQGQTWGYDERGIWVDRGCRAEFTIGDERRRR